MQFLTIRDLSKSPRETLLKQKKQEFMQNLTEMRLSSMKHRNSEMTLYEINAEIDNSRKERKRKIKSASGTFWGLGYN